VKTEVPIPIDNRTPVTQPVARHIEVLKKRIYHDNFLNMQRNLKKVGKI
jgi:hypothetical protein